MFKVRCETPKGWCVLERDTFPALGDNITVFDFPAITRYRIVAFEDRADTHPHDWYEPARVVLGQAEVLKAAAYPENDPTGSERQFLNRLEDIEWVARQQIDDRLSLHMCHADFLRLCRASCLPADLASIDIVAYGGMPLTVGEPGADWNACTSFEGFSDDMTVRYVTLPGGLPFIMQPALLEIAEACLAGRLTAKQAIRGALNETAGHGVSDERMRASIVNAFDLLEDGLMDPYDAAQSMSRTLIEQLAFGPARSTAQ